MTGKALISTTGLLAMLAVPAPAYAYLDPATGSIILQAVIGGIAGATLFFRTSLYRVKNFVAGAFGKSKADDK